MQTHRDIPFFNYPGLFEEDAEQYLSVMKNALSRGAFIMQKDLLDFEQHLADYLGCKHAIGAADGTAALILSLRAAGVGDGDEVIVSSHTFVATAAAVHHAGATPVVCDCLSDSMMDPESARSMITDKTKAIMPTQLNGRTCDMDALCALADEHGLKIVEDSCQALGARYKGTPAGLFGVAGSYSFYPAKTLGCFGDGGAVVTDSDEVAAMIRQMRDHGRGPDGKVTMFGHNGRLDNIQAAVLDVKLARYDAYVARRREIAARYTERLSGIEGLLLPPGPEADPNRFDIYQNYEIQADRRDALREHLSQKGVGTIIQWGGWMVHQFDDLNLRVDAPYAEEMSRRYMMLPMHHLLSDADVDHVCDAVLDFYQRNSI
ncbi:DegT/DnrJ/EryC1/StrS family aminotransferase [Roseovarius sp. E0-M6]|uniref:DegT/DnrJ/EryC1/StrS family aminotransferase n=1 Tax=Roseovarius sp. E0-M6 TaxID=3127118 RepID=UPI00300F9B09